MVRVCIYLYVYLCVCVFVRVSVSLQTSVNQKLAKGYASNSERYWRIAFLNCESEGRKRNEDERAFEKCAHRT